MYANNAIIFGMPRFLGHSKDIVCKLNNTYIIFLFIVSVFIKVEDYLVKKTYDEKRDYPSRQTYGFSQILMHYKDTKTVENSIRIKCHKEGTSAIDKFISSEIQNHYLKNIKEVLYLKDTYNCIIIEGAPGTGKSVLVRDIVSLWMRKEMLSEYKGLFSIPFKKIQAASKLEELFTCMTMHYLSEEEIVACTKYFVNDIQNRLCILINEVDEDLPINPFITKLLYGEILPNALMIVFCHPTCMDGLPLVDKRIKVLEIVGFNKKMRQNYVIESLSSTNANRKKLATYLRLHPLVNEICYIPLYLAIVVYLFKQDKLPETTTEMYELFILHVIHRHLIKNNSTFSNMHYTKIQNIPNKQVQVVIEELSRLAFTSLKKKENCLQFVIDEIRIQDVKTVKGFDLIQVMKSYSKHKSTRSIEFGFCYSAMQQYLAAYYVFYHLPEEKQLSEMKSTFWSKDFKYMWIMFAGITGNKQGKVFEKFLSLPDNLAWNADLSQLELPQSINEDKEKCLHLYDCFEESRITKKPVKILGKFVLSICIYI